MMDCMKLAQILEQGSAAGSQWITKGWACRVAEKGSDKLGLDWAPYEGSMDELMTRLCNKAKVS
jgi:hypothetical protein